MVLVFVSFVPILKNGFVWDDEYNLVNNAHFRGLVWSQISGMFSTFHDGNYHPLCWLSLGLDFKLWGMQPAMDKTADEDLNHGGRVSEMKSP